MVKLWLHKTLFICSSVSSDEWKATVVKSIDALVTSCVVVPCSFSHTGGNLPTFKDRTKMLGELGQNNCTLEITDVRNHDNGPFCFRVELVQTENNDPTKDKFSFVEDCVELNMLTEPPTPTLIQPMAATQGEPYTVICSVMHTCPTHVPTLTWNWKTEGIIVYHRLILSGNWETQSILTFIPEETDDNRELTCTAAFNGKKTSSSKFTLNVKRIENYNHIIIPAVVGIGTALLFGIFCIFMAKKYNAHSGSGRSSCPKWRSSSISGSCSRREIWSNVPADKRHQMEQRHMGASNFFFVDAMMPSPPHCNLGQPSTKCYQYEQRSNTADLNG
ncbi:ETS domain-containing transcription factor ERF [Sarotherodon galilaeus]